MTARQPEWSRARKAGSKPEQTAGNEDTRALSAVGIDHVLEPRFVEPYSTTIQVFQNQLIRLNANLFIVEHVARFPIDLFCEQGRRTFLKLVLYNALESAVMTTFRLWYDDGDDCLTMKAFKRKLETWVRAEFRSILHSQFRKFRHSRIESHRTVVCGIRNKILAHLDPEVSPLGSKEIDQLGLDALGDVRNHLVAYFEAMSIGGGYHTWVEQYSPALAWPKGSDARSDVERVLDAVARESAWITLPDRDPARWSELKPRLGAENVRLVEAYRLKFGYSRAQPVG